MELVRRLLLLCIVCQIWKIYAFIFVFLDATIVFVYFVWVLLVKVTFVFGTVPEWIMGPNV